MIQTITSLRSNPSVERICRPYQQFGELNVNTLIASQNRWVPLDTTSSFQPVDYMEMISTRNQSLELDFLRDRTIVLFGDSIDRE
jgi:hypothetical protein